MSFVLSSDPPTGGEERNPDPSTDGEGQIHARAQISLVLSSDPPVGGER